MQVVLILRSEMATLRADSFLGTIRTITLLLLAFHCGVRKSPRRADSVLRVAQCYRNRQSFWTAIR